MSRTTRATKAAVSLMLLIGSLSPPGGAAPVEVIFDMDSVRHAPGTFGEANTPAGTVEAVPGHIGSACRFTFAEGARGGFFTAPVRPTPAWDEAAGISFFVRGDGSKAWGGLELIDREDYRLRYAACFPIDATEWRKIVIPWSDLIPELPAGQPVDARSGYRPSRFGNLWFGKWHYWGEYPAHSFEIDHIALEPTIPDPDKPAAGPGLARTLAKLRRGEPVTIVTMGDSLSDRRHWANRELLWSDIAAESLGKRFGSEVRTVNPAIGGTQLTQNLILMPRWLDECPRPDVVTLWFGYNDWDSGMRRERFEQALRDAVDRVRRLTGGRADVLLMTTLPAVDRRHTMDELAAAVRAVAAEKNTGIADVANAFQGAGTDDATFAGLFCRDRVHLGADGHRLVAATVADAIAGDAPQTARPPATDDGVTVPREHPYLLGSSEDLRRLAGERAEAYARMKGVAADNGAGLYESLLSRALVGAIEGDATIGRKAVDGALTLVDGPIRRGHVPFGTDLALAGLVYDLCHALWTPAERERFHAYVNATTDANVESETHVFHNGWYAYKNWGIGTAALAGYHENPRAPAILAGLLRDYRTRAAPALELAGNGGGWAEGYYTNYWLYEWLFFCEIARHAAGLDLLRDAPSFYRNRAVAGMFEAMPGIREYGSRRPIAMGDGGGRLFGGDRDKALCARRILVNRYRDDPDHRAVHAFNETTPRVSVGNYAYKDFLWRDASVPKGDLSRFRLSHIAPGPGYVYARSSWDEDATHFFFKCGDRFTAHQHLDVGTFLITRHEELVGDGGNYDGFGTPHDVNIHLRTLAHSTMLVRDPAERWPGIRAGKADANDGGQHHAWPHHNGAVTDPQQWQKDKALYDIADLTDFCDEGPFVYVAGDASRAYRADKVAFFTRQIVFLRPGSFIVFDRVKSTDPAFRKTWLLQAMNPAEQQGDEFIVTNGKGRLFVQPLLPRDRKIACVTGDDLYTVDGIAYPPARDTGPAPACRMEISPAEPAAFDCFLSILTATDADVTEVDRATLRETDDEVAVSLGDATVVFAKSRLAARVRTPEAEARFPNPD